MQEYEPNGKAAEEITSLYSYTYKHLYKNQKKESRHSAKQLLTGRSKPSKGIPAGTKQAS